MRRFAFVQAVVFLVLGLVTAPASAQSGGETRWEIAVNGVARRALVIAPGPTNEKRPLVFAFHGHGGSAENARRSFAIEREWPEAIVVYPQGLNTPGRLTDPEGKRPGWQNTAGDEGDRDLHFFDLLLARVKAEQRVDEARVYATGHSNGGSFTYLLWAERGEVFAALAPSGALDVRSLPRLKPKPVLHLAGTGDPLVKYAWQRRMMDSVRRLNGCAAEGASWAPNAKIFQSPGGTPVVEWIHEGGHEFPRESVSAIVRFFKERARPAEARAR